MNKFNAARAQDPTISVDLVIEYTQDQWDALSDNEKGLYLSNKERIDRGIAPYAAVARQVSDVAEDYANDSCRWSRHCARDHTSEVDGKGRPSPLLRSDDRLAAALEPEGVLHAQRIWRGRLRDPPQYSRTHRLVRVLLDLRRLVCLGHATSPPS